MLNEMPKKMKNFIFLFLFFFSCITRIINVILHLDLILIKYFHFELIDLVYNRAYYLIIIIYINLFYKYKLLDIYIIYIFNYDITINIMNISFFIYFSNNNKISSL